MSFVFAYVEKFLLNHCSSPFPFLLALSGGADSLYLFYALLSMRERHGIAFHVAHVDHRWRKESQEEAHALQQLALQFHVPFHLKVLNPSLLKRNLEAACRQERYTFFRELMQKCNYQAVLTGHHQDDQAETVFKRLLEGAHWSRWSALREESWIEGMRVLRPLLNLEKKDIQHTLLKKDIVAFEDPSNRDIKFLRARLRETLFPRLNQEFGKEVQKNLALVGREAQELSDYFEERLTPLLSRKMQGPFGLFLDLQQCLPKSLIEIKYLLRLLCNQHHFFLSREMIEQAALALQLHKANQLFAMGKHRMWIDRQRIFIPSLSLSMEREECILLQLGTGHVGNWRFHISQEFYPSFHQLTDWKEGWMGRVRGFVPIGNYTLGFHPPFADRAFKKRWSQAKVPACLYDYFPLIWNDHRICHEFLTGKPLIPIEEGALCWKIELEYL